jgi:hypothetical protein
MRFLAKILITIAVVIFSPVIIAVTVFSIWVE